MMQRVRSLQIRNVPDEIYEALALRAERDNRSLAQQALTELGKMPELVRRRRRQEVLERILKRVSKRKTRRLAIPPEDLIRQDRDR